MDEKLSFMTPGFATSTADKATNSSTAFGHHKRDVYDMTIEKEERELTAFEMEFNKIKELGFSQYAKELEAEKIEKLKEEIRSQILAAMGISEDDLSSMPAEQRGLIEQMVEDEVKRRLAAMSLLNRDDEDGNLAQQANATDKPLSSRHGSMDTSFMLNDAASPTNGIGMLDPETLQHLQEVVNGDSDKNHQDKG